VDEVGIGAGLGKTVNVPFFRDHMHDGDYYTCFKHILIPITTEFDPSLILVSAGFDAAARDTLGPMAVTPAGFQHMLAMLTDCAGGRVVCVLEGGYNLENIANDAAACMRVLLGEGVGEVRREASASGMEDMMRVVAVQKEYWECMRRKGEDREWREMVHRVI